MYLNQEGGEGERKTRVGHAREESKRVVQQWKMEQGKAVATNSIKLPSSTAVCAHAAFDCVHDWITLVSSLETENIQG